MKRLYCIIALLFMGGSLYAQKLESLDLKTGMLKIDNLTGSVPVNLDFNAPKSNLLAKGNDNRIANCDTLNSFLDRSTGFTSYLIDMGGSICPLAGWNNGYLFVGQKYEVNQPTKVTEILFAAQQKIKRGTAFDSIAGVIFAANPKDGLPTSALGAGKIRFDKIDTNISNPVYTSIKMYQPIDVNSKFVAMLYTNNFTDEYDAIMLYTNLQGDGQTQKDACLIFMDNQGNLYSRSFYDFWSMLGVNMPDGNPPNFDVLVFPIIDDLSGVDEPAAINGVRVKSVYPVPAKDFATLEIALDKPSSVEIDLVGLGGAVVYSISRENCTAGDHSFRIDLSGLPSGAYYYLIKTNGTKFGGKLSVER